MQKPSTLLLLLLLAASLCTAQTTYQGGKINAEALFEQGMNSLSGGPLSQSSVDAVKNFRASADLGYAPAQVVTGYYEERVAGNSGAAVPWYRKAADQGDPLAQVALGRLYFTGSGVLADAAQAEHWLSTPAQHGDPFAQYLLGLLYKKRDYQRAPEWFRKAAEQGLPQAQRELGNALADGHGVNTDKFQAYVWLLVSSQAGDREAQGRLGELEGALGSNKTNEAKQQARALQDTVLRSAVAHGCTGWPGEFDNLPAPPPPHLHRLCR